MSTEVEAYHIKRLQAATITDLALLHNTVYKSRIPVAFFNKKYHTRYTGVEYIGYIAYNTSGMPIAFYGVIPCFLKHHGKQILSAQSADTMTHSQYRNMGLFVKLANLTFNLCRANGIKLLFGFPNQNSLPGFVNKLGWQVTDNMHCFIIPANKYNWEGYFKKLPMLKKLYRIYTGFVLKKHIVKQHGLENSVHNESFSGVDRKTNYLSYKTYHTSVVIQIQNAFIWMKINNGLIIGDMQLKDSDFDSVMKTIITLAGKIGVKHIIFHTSPGTTLHQLFNERYHATPSFPVIFKDLESGLSLNHFKFTTADIDIF